MPFSQQLGERGVAARSAEREAARPGATIVAQAGHKGAVTVATNIAGRGTDIKLGGDPDDLAEAELASAASTPLEHIEEWAAALPAALERAERSVKAEFEEVKDLGGLYVLGTERHESRRIDDQLRRRSGRQGDPGESRFYLSLGDDLMRLFKAQMVERVMSMANVPDDVPIENKMVTRAIASAQSQVEQQNFETRKNVLKYDEVLNRQREVIYGERRRVLEGEDLHDQVKHFIDDTIDAYIQAETVEGFAEEWDLDRLWGAFKQLYPVKVTIEELEDEAGDRAGITAEFIAESIKDDVHEQYAAREEQLGSEIMRELERRVVLSVLDRKWREHLYEMDYLQEGIGLRAMAQKDPLVEYQREGFDMFNAMMEGIKEESVGYLFNLEVQVEQQVEEVPVQEPAARPRWPRRRRCRGPPPAARPEIRPRASTLRSVLTGCTSPLPRSTERAVSSRATSRTRRRGPARSDVGRHDPRRAAQGAEDRRPPPQEVADPPRTTAGSRGHGPGRASIGCAPRPVTTSGWTGPRVRPAHGGFVPGPQTRLPCARRRSRPPRTASADRRPAPGGRPSPAPARRRRCRPRPRPRPAAGGSRGSRGRRDGCRSPGTASPVRGGRAARTPPRWSARASSGPGGGR